MAGRLDEAERALAELGALDVVELERRRVAPAAEVEAMSAELGEKWAELEGRISKLETRIVKTEETEIL